MEIKILTHTRGFVKANIPDDFTFLRVTLMTGDEIIEIYRTDPHWGYDYLYMALDTETGNRIQDFLDATYIVYPEHMKMWNERRDGYHIWQKDEFAKTFPGWFRP